MHVIPDSSYSITSIREFYSHPYNTTSVNICQHFFVEF
nr:MAG TPA: hypothetical protein [Caudoviricetes sp.]